MNLDTFTPPSREDGDRVPAKELIGRPLIVQVREHRTGIKTQFNSDPTDPGKYKPDGGEAVQLDVIDLTTNAIYIGILWFNGAIVDNLKGFVASTLPIKLVYETPKKGGNAYITVEPLTGQELAYAHQWAAANPTRLDAERHARALATAAHTTQTATMAPPVPTPGMPPIPGAPATPPPWAAPPVAPAPPLAPAAAVPIAAPVASAPASTPVATNDAVIQALLAQLNAPKG